MALDKQLGFLGAGNMAEAIGRGVLAAGIVAGDDVLAADPSDPRRAVFTDQLGVQTTTENAELARRCRTIVLAVKPQQMAAALAPLAGVLTAEQVLVSIAAGISTGWIERRFAPLSVRVIRAMPNTPMLVGAGMTALCRGAHAGAGDLEAAGALFDAAGGTLVVEEGLMDAVTAVSGSGPAYFFYFVEALTIGGIEAGLGEAEAGTLARATMIGAARLLAASDESPAELRRRVTSPGGTTEAALKSMADGRVLEQIVWAVQAAARRSAELGR